MTTRFQRHKKRWSKCQRCELCHDRTKAVLFRGRLPCDVLIVGEAPGASEDVLGKPFCGPAGKLLDRTVCDAVEDPLGIVSFGISNLVACIPLDEGRKAAEPPKKAIIACANRLTELRLMARPKLIVRVGKLATKHFIPKGDHNFVDLIHPAAILRMDISQQGLAYQRNVVRLQDALSEVT